MKLKMRIKTLLICAGMLSASVGFAQVQEPTQQQQQVEVSDAELQKFAKAFQGIQVAQQDAQRQMITVVEENDLDVATFNEIHQAKMENREVTASKEDQEKHQKTVTQLESMQPQIQATMEGIIKDQGLTVERYQEIATAMQNNPQLQQRLQQLIMG